MFKLWREVVQCFGAIFKRLICQRFLHDIQKVWTKIAWNLKDATANAGETVAEEAHTAGTYQGNHYPPEN